MSTEFGHAVVESAIAVIVLTVMLWGFIDVFRVIIVRLALEEACFTAARTRAVYWTPATIRGAGAARFLRASGPVRAVPDFRLDSEWWARDLSEGKINGTAILRMTMGPVRGRFVPNLTRVRAVRGELLPPGGDELRDRAYKGGEPG